MMNYKMVHHLHIEETCSGWALFWPDGSRFDSTIYKTVGAAKSALTGYRKLEEARISNVNAESFHRIKNGMILVRGKEKWVDPK